MPDISMCENQKCPSRKSCYRHTATPNEFRQSYGSFEVEKGKNKCEFYINNKEHENKRKTKNRTKRV